MAEKKDTIETYINLFLKDYFFEDNLTVSLKYSRPNWFLSIKDATRDSTGRFEKLTEYYNEAKLHTIMLLLLMTAALFNGSEGRGDDRALVLDDVISSMDAANRTMFIELLVDFFKDYQRIIFTHSISFFNLAEYVFSTVHQQRDDIFGVNIQDYAIERTKVLLSLLALSEGEDEDFGFNLLCRDTLDYTCKNWDARYTGFDVVVGNPPYVCSRNLSEDTHAKLSGYEVCSSGHPDLYIPFFQIAIEMLNDEGRLGYITMNTFLRSVNGRAIRKYFSSNRFLICIVDFRGYQVFDSKNTYTCLFYLDKQHGAESIHYAVDEQGVLSDDVHFTAVPFADLDDEKGWTLNDFDVTMAIEAVGVQIKDFCPSRHGIATLSNTIYIFKPISEDEQYFYIAVGETRFPIERGICRDIVNPNKLNTIDDLGSLIEKVIFPYRIEDGRAYVYTPDEMRRLFPSALAYLEANRNILLSRDKGKTCAYPQWFAFGRTQSLVMPRYKLFFPKFANKPLRCVICDAPDLMLYNGLAFVNTDERKLRILKSIIESNLFWSYIQANAKPYASGYYSLSGVDIKHFGIPKFTLAEENELLTMNDKDGIEKWLRARYGMTV